MQQPACDYLLEKDKDILEGEWHLDAETEQPPCGPEKSSSAKVPWQLPATQPLSCMGKTEQSHPEQPQSLGACPLHPQGGLSRKPCENQGSLLHFDRQAPGRISTSPTLRRLRGNGCGTRHSLPQQETLEEPTWGGRKGPAGSPCYLSQSLPASPQNSSHSLSTLRLGSRWPPDPKRILTTADSSEPQTRPTDEAAFPVLWPVHEGSLPPSSLPGRGSCSPSPAARPPGPQVTALSLLPLSPWAAEQHRPPCFHISPKASVLGWETAQESPLRGHTLFWTSCLSSRRGAAVWGRMRWKSSSLSFSIS